MAFRIHFHIVKTQSNAGLSISAFSFTMYCIVSLSLRKSRGCRLEMFEKLSGIAEGLDVERVCVSLTAVELC